MITTWGALRPALVGVLTLLVTSVLPTGEAAALAGADTGGMWVQAPWKNKIELTNVISRELGGKPSMYLDCLEKTFRNSARSDETILQAAKACKAKILRRAGSPP